MTQTIAPDGDVWSRVVSPKQKILVAAGALVVVGVVVAVMVAIGTGPAKRRVDLPSASELARLQIRSDPSNMEVLVGGNPRGKTPKMILVPRGDTPIDVSVRFPREGKVTVKHVVPNVDHQVIDFKPE